MTEEQKELLTKSLKTQWQHLLIDIGKSETQVAKELGMKQDILNRKIRTGSIKHIELVSILNALGYELTINKK